MSGNSRFFFSVLRTTKIPLTIYTKNDMKLVPVKFFTKLRWFSRPIFGPAVDSASTSPVIAASKSPIFFTVITDRMWLASCQHNSISIAIKYLLQLPVQLSCFSLLNGQWHQHIGHSATFHLRSGRRFNYTVYYERNYAAKVRHANQKLEIVCLEQK